MSQICAGVTSLVQKQTTDTSERSPVVEQDSPSIANQSNKHPSDR